MAGNAKGVEGVIGVEGVEVKAVHLDTLDTLNAQTNPQNNAHKVIPCYQREPQQDSLPRTAG